MSLVRRLTDLDRQDRRVDRGIEADYTVAIVTHNMQQRRGLGFHGVMYLGEMMEFGETDQIFIKPKRKETETTSPAASANGSRRQRQGASNGHQRSFVQAIRPGLESMRSRILRWVAWSSRN